MIHAMVEHHATQGIAAQLTQKEEWVMAIHSDPLTVRLHLDNMEDLL